MSTTEDTEDTDVAVSSVVNSYDRHDDHQT